MAADVSAAPRDLRCWKKTEAPKHKKDWPGKLLQVWRLPARAGFNRIPDGAILDIHRRVKEPGQDAWLDCRWPCPACSSRHDATIPESWLAKGQARFVAEAGLRPDGEFLYLASPYSHKDPMVRQERWLEASAAAAWLMSGGGELMAGDARYYVVFSPIAMGHPISVTGTHYGIAPDFEHWRQANWAFLDRASFFIALQIEGWESSVGMREELAYARQRGLFLWAMRKNGQTWAIAPQPDLIIPGPKAES